MITSTLTNDISIGKLEPSKAHLFLELCLSYVPITLCILVSVCLGAQLRPAAEQLLLAEQANIGGWHGWPGVCWLLDFILQTSLKAVSAREKWNSVFLGVERGKTWE